MYSLQKEPTASSGLTRRLRGGGTLRVVSDPGGETLRVVSDPGVGAAGAVSDLGGELVNSDSPDLSSSCDEKKTFELSQSPTERSVSFAPVVVAAAASNSGAAAASDDGTATASDSGVAAASDEGAAAAASNGGVAAASNGGAVAASNDGAATASNGGELAHGDRDRS